MPLSSAQVFQVSNFSIPHNSSPRDEARRYADAIVSWSNQTNTVPDLFFVIHPRTSDWLDKTPYYVCKAILLKEGILSQHVTTDLIRSSSQFDWSVANIALAAFVKLGGTPWLLDAPQADRELILGVGQSSLYDPENRQLRRYIGFTSCFTGTGDFRFLALARAAETRDEYLTNLESVVRESLVRACEADSLPNRITLHLPKEAGNEERSAIQKALSDAAQVPAGTQIRLVKVNESPYMFAIDPDDADGVPNRGSVVQIGDRDFIVYTEGREERQVWRQRTPTCLRVIPQDRAICKTRRHAMVARRTSG